MMSFHSRHHSDSRADTGAFRHAVGALERAPELAVTGGLVSAVTHDLRQPLTALAMNISAAIHFLRAPAPRIALALEALHDALAQECRMRDALRVLDDLAAHRKPVCEPVDTVAIVDDVVALVTSDVLARHVALELDVSHPISLVFGDAVLMRQALLNMVLDALEATSLSSRRHEPVRLSVRTAGDIVEVAVAHFGLRTEATVLEDWGLSLARSVVEAHGGTIVLEGDAETGVRLVTRWPTAPIPPAGAPHAR